MRCVPQSHWTGKSSQKVNDLFSESFPEAPEDSNLVAIQPVIDNFVPFQT